MTFEKMTFEKMTFLEMTNLDDRISEVAINTVEDFVDWDSQTGQIADKNGDFVVEFNVITPIFEIDTTEDLLNATVIVDTTQFKE